VILQNLVDTFTMFRLLLHLQPARCTNVARLAHLALHSGVASGVEGFRYFRKRVKSSDMSRKTEIRSKWLTVRLSESEEEKLISLCKKSTANALSEYARDVLLKAPINVRYRNQSADDFIEQIIVLKRELNSIGNNINQAVHKLHTLDHVDDIRQWAISNEISKKELFEKVAELLDKADKIHKTWSHE
jgi:MobC-like protein